MAHSARTLSFVTRTLVAVAGVLFCATFFSFDLNSIAEEWPWDPPGSPQAEQPLALGRQLFESRCSGCHGLDGRGGERAPDIATRAAALRRSDASIALIIRAGIPSAGMPAFPSLDDSTLHSLVAYLRFVQGKRGVAKLPGNPASGKSLFFGKARCSQCHTLAGSGGFFASDLSSYARTRAPAEIREAIVNPNSAGRTAVATAITTRDGYKYSGAERNEDNFSLQLQTSDGTFHLFLKSDLASIERETTPLMPRDYASTLSANELNDLIAFLMSTNSGKRPRVARKVFKEDEENE
jgi:cytochrome c oxidase cbb3-type subunit III